MLEACGSNLGQNAVILTEVIWGFPWSFKKML